MLIKFPITYDRIFLHFFDIHFLELKGVNKEAKSIKQNIEYECRMATRFAILAANEVLVPAASFFESEVCHRIISEFEELYSFGIIHLVGGGTSLFEYIDDKLTQYASSSHQAKRYHAHQKRLHSHPPFLTRNNSASYDISKGWLDGAENGIFDKLAQGSKFHLPANFKNKWIKAPENLGGQAFIMPHIEPLLFESAAPPTLLNRISGIINEEYFKSFTSEFSSGVLTELCYLAANHLIPSYGPNLPYKDILNELRKNNLIQQIHSATAAELMQMKTNAIFQQSLSAAISRYEERTANIIMEISQTSEDFTAAKIGIITALPKEFAAVCAVLGCGAPISVPGSGAGRRYSFARIQNREGKEHVVAVTFLTDMGNNSAALRAQLLKTHCVNVQHIIMTGIAGAVPNPSKVSDHVRLGDIVVSNREGVIQYDFNKEHLDKIEHRNPPRPPSASLLEAVQLLQSQELLGQRPWDEYIDRAVHKLGEKWQRPSNDKDILKIGLDTIEEVKHPNDAERKAGYPRIFLGPIASANILLKNPVKRDYLRDTFGVKAVEMEGAGIADATWNSEIGYLVIRGTCDYCNSDKGDDWQLYASVIAASYTRAIIEAMPA